MSSLFDLSGKRVLVTGAASGIGRSLALALANAGADVAVVDSNESEARRTASAIERMGHNSVAIGCDVADASSVQNMMAAVVRGLGGLDVAVNNAGIYRAGEDESQAKEDWDRVIGVNLTGVWLCAQAEMRQMIQQTPTEGKIINIASIGATRAISNGSYDSSKAAVVHLSRALASRWGGYNINVNSVSPGYIGRAFGESRPPEERQRLRDTTPLGYVGRMDDLHGPVLFLASRASDFVTGQDLVVDGGHTLSTWMQPLRRHRPPRVSPVDELME